MTGDGTARPAQRYRVLRDGVTVKTASAAAAVMTGRAAGMQGCTRGAILPGDVDAETIGHLLRAHLIEPVEPE
ncbi:MAG: hypothetical protein ACRDNZ_15815 [Streptosporangiaceae bacterium]